MGPLQGIPETVSAAEAKQNANETEFLEPQKVAWG